MSLKNVLRNNRCAKDCKGLIEYTLVMFVG